MNRLCQFKYVALKWRIKGGWCQMIACTRYIIPVSGLRSSPTGRDPFPVLAPHGRTRNTKKFSGREADRLPRLKIKCWVTTGAVLARNSLEFVSRWTSIPLYRNSLRQHHPKSQQQGVSNSGPPAIWRAITNPSIGIWSKSVCQSSLPALQARFSM
jgi:hypothetical protein